MCKDHQKKLDKLLKPFIKKATLFIAHSDDSALELSYKSKLGGTPYAENNDTWPICPSCTNKLTFVAQIYNEDEDSLFVFFYCHECFPWGLDNEKKGEWIVKSYEHPSCEKWVEISQNEKDEFAPSPCTLTASNINVLPDWEALDAEASNLCSRINDDDPWDAYEGAVERAECLNNYATLLGGYPRFVQGESSPTCPECKTEMEFYAQIDSEDEANMMWGDAGLVYFFRCPQHKNLFQFELQCH